MVLYKYLMYELPLLFAVLQTTTLGQEAILTGGATPNQGELWVREPVHGVLRVYVSYDQSDKLLYEAPRVACRMLGLPGHPRIMPFSSTRHREKVFVVKHCYGNETSLFNCTTSVDSETHHKRQLRINCGRPSVNVEFLNSTNQSSVANGSSLQLALDNDANTCFSTREEEDPWVKLRLERQVYVHEITMVTKNAILATVKLSNSKTGQTSYCRVTMDTGNKQTAKCSIEFETNIITIGLQGVKRSLSLCRLQLAAFDSFKNALGVIHRHWTIPSKNHSVLKLNVENTQSKTEFSVMPSFTFLRAEEMGIIKLHALMGYLLVSKQGLYIVSALFKSQYELWVRIAKEPGLDQEGTGDELVSKLDSPVAVLDDESIQSVLNFSKCHLYHVEALTFKRANTWNNFAILVMKPPGEKKWYNFFKDQVYWTRPGHRVLHFDVMNNISDRVERGSHVIIQVSYKFCCSGLICPSCPISIYFHAFGRSVLVNQSLLMNCEEYHFTYPVDVYVKQANYSVQISYSFVGDIISTQHRRTIIKSIQVTASKIYSCSFDGFLCEGWKQRPYPWNNTKDDLTSLQISESSGIGFPFQGNFYLESPWLPWNPVYSRISFCLQFSYLLLTNTTSSLEVHIVTRTTYSQLLWSISGFQGNAWARAGIPVSTREAYKIVFKGNSILNDTIGVSIKQLDVNTEKCTLHPYHAAPGYSCKAAEFQCSNGQCVSKTIQCNGVKDGCLDGSDENGCDCPTGYLRCSDQTCIKTNKLCDGVRDCQDGMDERHCDKQCPDIQCFDGTCSSEACNSKTSGCQDNSHQFSCRYCSAAGMQSCMNQSSSDLRCQALKGLCGFENGPCKLYKSSNSSLEWRFFSPALTQVSHNYPRYDHTTMTEEGTYFLLQSNNSIPNGHGSLALNFDQAQLVCLQFWYVIPSESNSKLELFFTNIAKTTSLWRTAKSTSGEWTFGQVEISNMSTGKLLIVGHIGTGYVALDDIGFTEGHCTPVINQDNPSCYFNDGEVCNNWLTDNAWQKSKTKLPELLKYFSAQDSIDKHLTLSRSLSNPSIISSPMIYPRHQGWQCLRFWFYSGKNYFERSLSVSFVSENGSKQVWSYNSANDKWNFIQLQISKNYTSLKVIFTGQKHHENAILAVDDVTFSKEQCQNIPVLSSPCQEYKVLNSKYRRLDLLDDVLLIDSMYGTKTWYRVTGQAGNQMANYCDKILRGKSHKIPYVWLNGTNPTLEDGEVQRHGCLAFSSRCFLETRKVMVRNCSIFLVYQFPDQRPFRFSPPVTTMYEHKVWSLSAENEWQDWLSTSNKSRWMITSEDQHEKIIQAIRQESDTSSQQNSEKNDRDFGLLLKGNASIRVHTKGLLTAMTLCVWISLFTSSPFMISVDVSRTSGTTTLASIGNFTSDELIQWKHMCVSWKSSYGLWQVYIDGMTSRHGRGVLDKIKLEDAMILINIESNTTNSLVKFSRLNMWDKVLTEHEILYMSYECGQENGSLVKWSEYRNNISAVSDHPVKEYRSTCTGKQGNVMSVITEPHSSLSTGNQTALIMSPRYERSSESPGRCLRFRYKLWGPGARTIKIYQKLDNKALPWRPVWMDDDNGTRAWREGQVTLAAVTGYQVVIESQTTDAPGLSSIGALYTTEGYCSILPTTADPACNELLTADTGYVISPYYPGYYSNNANCTWTIKAKQGHVIRLEIKAFELEMSPRCSADSVEVYDGQMQDSFRIGRYCGVRYLPIIQSTFNNLFVRFTSNNRLHRSGFMAKYQTVKDTQGTYCVQDCPSDCICRRNQNHHIIISSQHLRSAPDRFPRATSLVLFSGSHIFQIETEAFYNLHYLVFVDLSFNNILKIEKRSFVHLQSLEGLRLNRNFLRHIDEYVFIDLPKLKSLDFGENLISTVESHAFWNLTHLRVLSLRSNMIKELDLTTFKTNKELEYLYLHENHLENIPSRFFFHQQKLKTLSLHGNKLQSLNKYSFEGLVVLEKLTLRNNTIKESTVPQDAFDHLNKLKHLTLDSFILCCYAKKSLPTLKSCESPGNGFSSCEDMLKSVIVQLVIWIQGIFASFGNLIVIIWWAINGQQKTKRKSHKFSVQSLLLSNLALADFLMGVYLAIIAVQHTIWKGEYFKHDVEWRSGIKCQIAGAISTLSSEVSVMVLVAITTDRANSFLFEFSRRRLSLRLASIICLCIWIIGFIVAFVPLFIPSYFEDTLSGFSFYGRSTVCLPLQLSSERPAGWEYSIAVFNVFNGVAFIYILLAYTAIFIKVQRSAKSVRSSKTSQSSLGKRLAFVILTDFCCWMPVVVLGVLSLTGNFQDPTGEVYAWVAVLVLPINSSINPILYTFSTPQVTKKLQAMKTKWQTSQASSCSTKDTFKTTSKQDLKEFQKTTADQSSFTSRLKNESDRLQEQSVQSTTHQSDASLSHHVWHDNLSFDTKL